MKNSYIFQRIEKKYMLKKSEYERLIEKIGSNLEIDEYGESTVCSIYLDTDDWLLIRNSIEAVAYKEKLRLRSYGSLDRNSMIFFEIKKKYLGTVYKRRAVMRYEELQNYILGRTMPQNSQIMNEIDYLMNFYGEPKPKTALFYERSAYTAPCDDGLRLTFDRNVRYRTHDFFSGSIEGKSITDSDSVLMEIKTPGAMPLWLSHALDENMIYPTSFSKYGTAYRDMCRNNINISKGELLNV
ncbi:MAG: polyphosphate polymerase domain-containing protein [Clostridiales bacterium]|nr:polyphosphate polymerase domain-containing protein [Clostridiales bacterium]